MQWIPPLTDVCDERFTVGLADIRELFGSPVLQESHGEQASERFPWIPLPNGGYLLLSYSGNPGVKWRILQGCPRFLGVGAAQFAAVAVGPR